MDLNAIVHSEQLLHAALGVETELHQNVTSVLRVKCDEKCEFLGGSSDEHRLYLLQNELFFVLKADLGSRFIVPDDFVVQQDQVPSLRKETVLRAALYLTKQLFLKEVALLSNFCRPSCMLSDLRGVAQFCELQIDLVHPDFFIASSQYSERSRDI